MRHETRTFFNNQKRLQYVDNMGESKHHLTRPDLGILDLRVRWQIQLTDFEQSLIGSHTIHPKFGQNIIRLSNITKNTYQTLRKKY